MEFYSNGNGAYQDPAVTSGSFGIVRLTRVSQLGEEFLAFRAVAIGMIGPLDHPSPEKGGPAEAPPIDKEMPHIGKLID